MITVEGKHGVKATVLAHSISPQGIQIASLEVEYPRIVLAELNTHGMVCKNSHSSRAIPFEKMSKQLTGRPIRFGANQPGMQDKGEEFRAPVFSGLRKDNGHKIYWNVEDEWETAREDALYRAQHIYEAGYHKQVYNRLTEPFQMMKTVLTATEFANFFWLRNHGAADPSLEELARCMHEALSQSTPKLLLAGEWHLPYVGVRRERDGYLSYFIDPPEGTDPLYLTKEEALAVSTARSAAVSFRNVDYGVEKSKEVFQRLLSDQRVHGSAFQHQATPIMDTLFPLSHGSAKTVNSPFYPNTWEEGVTHSDRNGQLWSAQFKGWLMHRKLIKGENVPGFFPPND